MVALGKHWNKSTKEGQYVRYVLQSVLIDGMTTWHVAGEIGIDKDDALDDFNEIIDTMPTTRNRVSKFQ